LSVRAERCSITADEIPRSEGYAAQPDTAEIAPSPGGPAPNTPPTPFPAKCGPAIRDEDRLDLLENAARSAADRRSTDRQFIGRSLLLLAVLLALVAGAVLLWSRLHGK
jgi:hypothetical protein